MTDPNKPIHVTGQPLAPDPEGMKKFAHCPRGHQDYAKDIARGECGTCKRERLDAREIHR